MKAEWIGQGCVRVTLDDGRAETVYVAGAPGERWAFWKGELYRERLNEPSSTGPQPARHSGRVPPVTAPMPATVLKVLVAPGQHVPKGATLVIVEAMKMELPLRAAAAAQVAAVRCREGELVSPDTVLVEFTTADDKESRS